MTDLKLPTNPRFVNITGKQFGYLLAIHYIPKGKWLVKCYCGTEKIVQTGHLLGGNTKSCGCLQKDLMRQKSKKHGMWESKEYSTWSSMKQRCYNSKNLFYKDYGGRGIRICDRWKDSFENFFADMGKKPTPKHSIDRIDVNGNYEPSNCRWATPLQQGFNQRKVIVVEFKGEKVRLLDLCKEYNKDFTTVRYRMKRGYPLLEALTKNIRGH